MTTRIVVYPIFAAGHDEMSELVEKIADVMLAHHGQVDADDDNLRSIVVLEQVPEDLPDEGDELFRLISENAAMIVLPGAPEEIATWPYP